MARIICITNQKGGVGKTTTAVNLASCLAAIEKRTLLVDMDPQGNSTSGVGLDKNQCDPNIYQVIMGDANILQTLQPTELKKLFCVPSNGHLIGAEVELVSQENRETRLKKALSSIEENFDFILIDCPPSLGFLTLNALTAANSVLIPVQSEYYALEGLSSLMETVDRVREDLNPKLEIEGALLTMYDARTRLASQVTEEVRKYFGEKVYNTVIPRNVQLSESPSHGKPIILYDIRSSGAQAYLNLTKEIVTHD
ncbi:MAG TPA: AAA family ATPase [bacterium]|nr:AAA family ATPase [bacterium]